MAAAQSNDTRYPQCLSYSCGNISISYPFWKIGSEATNQYCGYPGFGINCYNEGEGFIPSINLGDDSYNITKIIYETNSIVLVDDDVSAAVDDCLRVRHTIDLDTLPFTFWGRNVNLSFHFNCSGVPPFAREIECLSNVTDKSCVHSVNFEPPNFSWDRYSCDDAVVTTVLDIFNPSSRLETEFSGALRGGFELRWDTIDIDNCEKCENSGGRCGYINITTQFICFCGGGKTSNGDCKGTFVKTLIPERIYIFPAHRNSQGVHINKSCCSQ